MYNEQLEKLIDIALMDGEITEKEKQILFKKAELLGIDVDEFEMVLDAKLNNTLKANTTKANAAKEAVQKCPSCGEIVSGLSRVCSSCGFVFAKQSNSELDKGLFQLEDTLVELKSFPKPSVYKIIKPIILIYFTMGIYILYKKLYKKEHIFSSNNSDFEQTIAKTDKQIRMIKNSYGENPQVKKLLLEIGTEKNIIISERKKSKVIAIGITVGIFATFCLIGYLQPKPVSKRVEQLIEEGKIEEAKAVVNKLKSTDYNKATLQTEITEVEVEKLIEEKKFNEARLKAADIKELQTKITEVEVEKLIEEKKFNEALQAASLIKSEYERNNLIGKIIERDVNLLITLKEFKKAKLKAADIKEEYKRQQLIQKITNAEKFNK